MITIDIWIASDIKGPRKRDGRGAYRIRASDGSQGWERTFGTEILQATGNAAILFTLTRAARYIDRILQSTPGAKADIRVHTDSDYILVNWYWVKMWKAEGWKTKNSRDIQNKDLWMIIDKLLLSRTSNPVRDNGIAIDALRTGG